MSKTLRIAARPAPSGHPSGLSGTGGHACQPLPVESLRIFSNFLRLPTWRVRGTYSRPAAYALHWARRQQLKTSSPPCNTQYSFSPSILTGDTQVVPRRLACKHRLLPSSRPRCLSSLALPILSEAPSALRSRPGRPAHAGAMSSLEPSAADTSPHTDRIVRELDVYVCNGALGAGTQVGWGVATAANLAPVPSQHVVPREPAPRAAALRPPRRCTCCSAR